ncbi:MAG: hypothetical protein TECD_00113 [Hyphomicrobiaceae bacterium hypho_1]
MKGRYFRGKKTVANLSKLSLITFLLVIVLISPIISVILSILEKDNGTISHMLRTTMSGYVANSVILVFGVGIGVLAIGSVTAWLVVMCDFPGRRFFEWALVVPLAMPAYIIAYAYTDFLSHSGAVQSALRSLTGWGSLDYWFPNVRSVGGAITMFILVLYPYVYLLARTAFLRQSADYIAVSRTLGRSAFGVFWSVGLPLARPAIAGGVALALMETLADYGTVAHFGVQTFTTGIYKAWYSMDDLIAAGQLATMLLTFVFVVAIFERQERNRFRFDHGNTLRGLPRYVLYGYKAWIAFIICLIPVLLGFLIPITTLINLNIVDGHNIFSANYISLIINSFSLSAATAIFATALALLIMYSSRLSPSWLSEVSVKLSHLGYAVPGSVIAIGIMLVVAGADYLVDLVSFKILGITTGTLLTGSVVALIMAYTTRFIAVSLNSIETSLSQIPQSMDNVARTLGSGKLTMLRRVHLPLIRSGLLTAALMVFVDVMKELPATLLLRPFNFDTLATQAYRLASDERLAQASTPSLVLVGFGLIPVILLSRKIMATRIGDDKDQTKRVIPSKE